MFVMMHEPDWFDLDGWKKHLDWLRTTPEAILDREAQIASAVQMVVVLESPSPAQRPTEAA